MEPGICSVWLILLIESVTAKLNRIEKKTQKGAQVWGIDMMSLRSLGTSKGRYPLASRQARKHNSRLGIRAISRFEKEPVNNAVIGNGWSIW